MEELFLILDASSGMGKTKAIAYAAVKEVIENGILVDYIQITKIEDMIAQLLQPH